MVITHYGTEFFKVTFGDITLAFNPVSKASSCKQTRFGADIALVSLEHADTNGVEQVSHGEKAPFVIRGPGEYEIRDILIKGYATVSHHGGSELINTVYLVRIEKMLLLFLGALDTKELPVELKETLDAIDILFVPIGGAGVLDPTHAHELAVSIEPKIVIPMHYTGVGEKDALDRFLKEGSTENGNTKPLDKFTVKARDIADKESEVVLLSA